MNKRLLLILFIFSVLQNVVMHASANNTTMYTAYLNETTKFIKSCDKKVLVAFSGVFLVLAVYLFVRCNDKQNASEGKQQIASEPEIKNEQQLGRDEEYLLSFAIRQKIKSLPEIKDDDSDISLGHSDFPLDYFDTLFINIQTILDAVGTLDKFNVFSLFMQSEIKQLLKEQEDAVEEALCISEYPTGIEDERFQLLIKNGLLLSEIKQDSDFYKVTGVLDLTEDYNERDVRQIDDWLDYQARSRLFYEYARKCCHLGCKQTEGLCSFQHYVYRERAQLYAHITNRYKDAIGCIAKILENTQTHGLPVQYNEPVKKPRAQLNFTG